MAKLDITILGDLKDFLKVNIHREKDGRLHVSQLYLISQIIDQTHMRKAKSKLTPTYVSEILKCNKNEPNV